MAVNTAQFGAQAAALIVALKDGSLSDAAFATQFLGLVNSWGVSNPQLLSAIVAQTSALATIPTQLTTWLAGPADGGFHADGTPSTGAGDPLAGYYPVTNVGGAVFYIPSPAKAAATTAKGDKGDTGDTGASPTLRAGAVSKLAPTAPPTFQLDNTDPLNPVIALGLPQGATGATGPAPVIRSGTVTALAQGAAPTASIDNTDPLNPKLNLSLPQGVQGYSVRNGSGAPTASTTAVDGDFYIDTTAWKVYGPRAGSVWPAGVNINAVALASAVDVAAGRSTTSAVTPASLASLMASPASTVTGVGIADSVGYLLIEVTANKVNHPDINQIRAQAAQAAAGAGTAAMSMPGFGVTDRANNLLIEVTKDKVNHPDINQMRSGLAALTPVNYGALALLAEICHVLIYGQSLSVGWMALPPLSTIALAYALRFSGGVRAMNGGSTPSTMYASLQQLVETSETSGSDQYGETVASSCAEMIRQLLLAENGIDIANIDQQLLFSAPGQIGTDIAGLSLGSTPFGQLTNDLTYGKSNADALGLSYSPAAMLWMQGEQDISEGTAPAVYQAALQKLRTDAQTAAQNASGLARPLPLITYQTCTHPGYSVATPSIAMAQLALAESDPYVALAAPTYQMDYVSTSNVHMANTGQQLMGAYFGLALKRWLYDGVKPKFLQPGTPVRQGKSVTIPFSVPTGPLVFDTSKGDPGHKGFSLVDSTGVAMSISGVGLVGTSAVKITASTAIPVGAQVRYGWTGLSGAYQARGCLRDSSPISFQNPYGNSMALYNWAPIFGSVIS